MTLNAFMLAIVMALVILSVAIAVVFRSKSLSKLSKLSKSSKPATIRGDERAVFPFSPMPIMTPTEIIFFKKLQQAVPEYLIFGQVQLSRMIKPNEEELDKSFWLNRINRMSVDYVVIANDYQTILLAIELDDWTHDSQQRQQADDKKDKALSSAGVAVIRFDSEQMPSIEQLRHQILQIIAMTT